MVMESAAVTHRDISLENPYLALWSLSGICIIYIVDAPDAENSSHYIPPPTLFQSEWLCIVDVIPLVLVLLVPHR